MRLGLAVGPHSIDVAVEEGVKGVPVNLPRLAEESVGTVLAPLQDKGLAVCQISAFMFNPLSPDEAKREQARAWMEAAIPKAADTGCPHILICGGNYDPSNFMKGHAGNFTDEALDAAATGLEPLVKLAERHGAKIQVEPYIHTVVNTPERFLQLKEKIGAEALTVTLDVCNFYEYRDMYRPTEYARRVCEALAGHFGTVHAKDMKLEPGFHIHINECPLGEGVTDWATALGIIAETMPADGWVVLEHAKTPEDTRTGLRNLRAAAERAGVVLE